MKNSAIKTKTDPKDFRAKYRSITVRDGGEFETTASTEIINEDYDAATGMFTMEVALHYPRRGATGVRIMLAQPARQEGKPIAIEPPCYMLTQADFEAVMRGEVIDVPACHCVPEPGGQEKGAGPN